MAQSKIAVDLILSKLAEDAEKSRERVQKASNVLLEQLDTEIATTPYEVVYEEDRVKLKHYHPVTEPQIKTPLLVVYALINRETMLDLRPGTAWWKNFLDDGIDLYMIDWGYPTRKDRYLTIDDHVNGYIDNIVDHIRQRPDVPKLNLIGVCMGGSFSVMYSALHPAKIHNLMTTVTPTNFDTEQGLLHILDEGLRAYRRVDGFGDIPRDLIEPRFPPP